ncbi:MAG: molybdopterin cofactor-binding domain-containing protein, partial [Bacteroidota bacterium]
GFSWLASCNVTPEQEALGLPDEWFEINGYLKIGDNGLVTIMSPNPEIGQNVKTSMPMIVAEELDAKWANVVVEQAPLNTDIFTRQLAGGSQSIRQGWESLRMAGATARRMLIESAAKAWEVPVEEITTSEGTIIHEASGNTASYGEMAAGAVGIEIPEEIPLKDPKDFKIIGTPTLNVDGKKIVTGKPLFGIDYKREGMLIAGIIHAPAFGMKLKSMDASAAETMPGIQKVFKIDTYNPDQSLQWCDITAFPEMIAVVGNSTWEVMQAKKAIQLEWEKAPASTLTFQGFRPGQTYDVDVPSGLENTETHEVDMAKQGPKLAKTERQDGDPKGAFKRAVKVIERSYSAPFLAHNCMEPMNFFAHVTDEKADLVGPIQTPEYMEKSVSERIGLPIEQIDIQMTRMGGGFGRRLYGHFLVEAAVISKEVGAPVKLVYTREDDMTFGTYRPAYYATYKAGLDENNNLIAFHVNAGGIPETPLMANRFPAGAVDNYQAES